jgi:murein DD-endopeptidase MepM/ murein hydrolase activator NlpD
MADAVDNVSRGTTPATVAPGGARQDERAQQTPEQLKLLAAQFEAMLMGQMLKQMQSAMFDDDSNDDAGFAKGPLGDAMYTELSQALSRAGGLGLTETMLGPLLRQAGQMDLSGGESPAGFDLSLASLAPAAMSLPSESGINYGGSALTPAAFSLGAVSSKFGWRSDPLNGAQKFHKGVDVPMAVGQEVPVARSGRVSFAGEQQGYGLTILVDHGPGLSTRYAHLSELLVAEGEQVEAGQTIGKSGASGRVTGPHLHFEVLENGQPVDPSDRLARLGTAVQVTD